MAQTGFDSGQRQARITVLNKATGSARQFGEKTSYHRVGKLWATYRWNKGTRALREGALDAYNTVMFQLQYSGNAAKAITRESLIEYDDRIYQIQSLNSDHRDNKIVITATEMTTQVNIIPDPYSSSGIEGGSTQSHEVG